MPTMGLSKPNAITPISDPVHGRIDLTIFDRDLVDHRYFQRLHFILQNSVNYVSFPGNKNSRFPHSLGVAHFSSKMFVNGLNNSDTASLRAFLDIAADFLVRLDKTLPNSSRTGLVGDDSETSNFERYNNAYQTTIEGRSGFMHVPLAAAINSTSVSRAQKCGTGKIKLPAGFVVDTLWQAIRLYGLVHDIGHLPMSHAFETAVEYLPQTIRLLGADANLVKTTKMLSIVRRKHFTGLTNNTEKYFSDFANLLDVDIKEIRTVSRDKQLHETRGISLYNIFISKYSKPSACFDSRCSEDIDKYGLFIHHLTLSIILSPAVSPSKSQRGQKKSTVSAHKFSFLFAVRQIVDGEVDGDRIDYTIRDSQEAGLETGIFDCDRIADFSLMTASPDPAVFAFGFFHRALPAIEQFFEARYQCYKYQIFHRTTVRSNKCVEELISTILSFAFIYPNSQFATIVDRYGYVSRKKSKIIDLLPVVLDFIEKIDDSTLRSLLFEVKEVSTDITEQNRLKQQNDGSYELSQVIRHMADVVLFRDFSKICTVFKEESLASLIESATGSTPSAESVKKFAVAYIPYFDDFVFELRRSVWTRSIDETGIPILIFAAEITARVFEAGIDTESGELIENLPFEKEVWVIDSDGSREKVALKSPSLRSMFRRKTDDRRSYVYAVGKDMKSPNSTELEIVREEALKLIRTKFTNLQ